MVCLGNICRSPMAEGILKHKLKSLGIDALVDSAGTSDWHEGELPDRRSIETMEYFDIDITDQRSRPLKRTDLTYFDRIFVMDQKNYHDVVAIAKTEEERLKIQCILSLIPNAHMTDVPDPYYGGDDGFEQVYRLLDEAINVLVAEMR